MKLKGKKALITGGGSGMGLEMAKELIAQGVKVIICGRTLSKLENAKRENPDLDIIACDVTSNDDIVSMLKSIKDNHGGIDIYAYPPLYPKKV
jgi:uncharacterized oxidoreductase